MTLNGLLRSPVVRFTYTYDFGDNWQHTVAFEKSEPAVEGVSYPVCITGKRNCPPEDCGGVRGYEELLAILANPTHPEHAERINGSAKSSTRTNSTWKSPTPSSPPSSVKNSRRLISHPPAKRRDVSNYPPPLPIAPNFLARDLTATEPRPATSPRLRQGGLHIPTDGGRLYLAAVVDLLSRKVVDRALRDHLRTEWASRALTMAVTAVASRGADPSF